LRIVDSRIGDRGLSVDGLPIADWRLTDCGFKLPTGSVTSIGNQIDDLQSVNRQSAIDDRLIDDRQSTIRDRQRL
jgi:hypothetical protein